MRFADDDVPPAFPEFNVQIPRVGKGLDKVAYRIVNHDKDDLALKILTSSIDEESDVDDVDDASSEAGVENPGDSERTTVLEGTGEGDLRSPMDFATERFRRELQGMSATDCPHIIRVVHEPQLRLIGSTTHIWYAEPFLAGGTLHDRLKQGALPPDEVHGLARSLFLAVEAMWGSDTQFVHRDIKPKNIGYTADGTVVLLDLGIALFTQLPGVTSTSLLTGPGTGHYAAPEQFEFRKMATIDFRTDLFQIGIVIVEALTGAHPFKSANDYRAALMNFDPKTLDGVEMSDGLRQAIPRLLASSQSRRFRKPNMPLALLDGDA